MTSGEQARTMDDVNADILAAQVCPDGWTMIRSNRDVDRLEGRDLVLRFQSGVELGQVRVIRSEEPGHFFVEHRFVLRCYVYDDVVIRRWVTGEQYPGSRHPFWHGAHVRPALPAECFAGPVQQLIAVLQ